MYTITPRELEADMVWLQSEGYETVTPQQVIDYVHKGAALPEKPVMLTFDDGYYNNIFYGTPLLEKYSMRAVMFAVGAYCDRAVREDDRNPNYSYITWDDMKDMSLGGVWDIQSHTYDMHSEAPRLGVRRRSGESDGKYRAALREDITRITESIAETTDKVPNAFAYPFGAITPEAEEILREKGYRATFSSYEGTSVIRKGDEASLFQIKRCLRRSGRPASGIVGRQAACNPCSRGLFSAFSFGSPGMCRERTNRAGLSQTPPAYRR
jgi:peptidoglycan/xylan/chitin deacetylase (PgdA/CDA1 family)